MSPTFRPDRVADQIRSELSEILAREVHDPGIGFITLTRVHVTADLQLARVYYTSLGPPTARVQTRRGLKRAAAFLRRRLGARLDLRRVPELDFVFDESVERQERVERLIEELRSKEPESEQRADHDDDDSPQR